MKSLFFVIFLTAVEFSFAQSDIWMPEFVGNVSSIDKGVFEAIDKNGSFEKGDSLEGYLNYKSNFNENGKLISYQFSMVGVTFPINYYKYNSFDKIDSIYEDTILSMAFEYDLMGNLIKEISFTNGERKSWKVYSYNDNGNIADIKSYANDTVFIGRWIKVYDNNLLIKEFQVEENNDSPIAVIRTYKYDKNGRLLTKISKDDNRKYWEEDHYQYDIFGSILSYQHVDKYKIDESFEETHNLTYDDENHLTKETIITEFYDNKAKTHTTEILHYDSFNNWIKGIITNKDKVIIIERNIKYN